MEKKIKLNTVSRELILDRMRFENPWWVAGTIDNETNSMKRRLFFDAFFPLITDTDIKRAVVLMGPRRVGKTVMLYHSIEKLLANKVNRDNICFLGVDNPIYLNKGLDELFALARTAVGSENADDWFVFFDEIQYLKNWELHLKVLVDTYPNTKFIVSGSASAALKLKSTESGAGRFTEFLLPPLTFHEYIHLKGYENLMRSSTTNWDSINQNFYTTINIKELNKHFIDYINYGGYPEVIFSEKIQANPGRYIKNDIIDKVLLRDLPSLYGIQDVQELNSFFTTLAYQSGNEVSLDALSKGSGVDKNLIKKYLEYLDAAFLIKIVNRIDDNIKKFKRATFYKIYLTNPSLRCALFSPIGPTDEYIGSMVETAIFSQLVKKSALTPMYARWSNGRFQGEVDMIALDDKKIKPKWVLEIKWSNRYFDKPIELKSLLQFCQKNHLESAMVTTLDKEGAKKNENILFKYLPSSVFAYTLGANTVQLI